MRRKDYRLWKPNRTLFSMVFIFMIVAPVFAQDVPLRATLLGDMVILDDSTSSNIGGVSVAYNGQANEYRVAWYDSRITGQNDVYCQRLAQDGTLLGSDVTIIAGTDSSTETGIAYNSTNNQYLVTWKNQSGGPGSPGFNHMYGAIASADGGLITGVVDLSNAGFESTVIFNPTAQEYFFTARNFAGGGTSGIYGRRVSTSGSIVGGNIIVSSSGAPAPCGGMAYDSINNCYLSTWRNQSDSNLKGRLVDSDGTFITTEFVISSMFPESGMASGVAFDKENEQYLVIFSEFCCGGIFGQFVDTMGNLVGTQFTIVETTGARWEPTLAYDALNNVYLLAWTDSSAGGVTLQLLYDDGSLAGDAIELDNPGNGSSARIAPNTTQGGFLLTWVDRKYSSPEAYDVLGQLVGVAPSYLVADSNAISARDGGIVNFELAAGVANANRTYIVLGSATGTTPGTALPGGHVTLPLNWDIFTDIVLQLMNTTLFANFLGTLDTSGEAAAQINAPPLPATTVGTQLDFAYTLRGPYDFVSNPEHVEIIN